MNRKCSAWAKVIIKKKLIDFCQNGQSLWDFRKLAWNIGSLVHHLSDDEV